MSAEPARTALGLLAAGLLAAACVLFSSLSRRFGVPVVLVFLALGMLGGSEAIGGVHFEDYSLAFQVGTVALVLILFDGGLNTPLSSVGDALRPAVVLATLGVVGTAALVAVGARLLGFPWREAALLGAVVSSTDAAAVFTVLRGSVNVPRRLARTLELESGGNDPMAVILTMTATGILAGTGTLGPRVLLSVVLQIAVGAAFGLAFGFGGRRLLRAVWLPAGGLYPVLTLALALLAFAVPTLLSGSGFLAVYLAALALGSAPLPYRSGLVRVHDGFAWVGQVAMFLLLGLLVFPSELLSVAGSGFGLALFLALVARPAVTLLCLLPFGYSLREMVCIGWLGLRGAVPIVLATFPVLAGVEGAHRVFNVVFFVVVVSALLQGGTARWLARRLGLDTGAPPPLSASVEITSTLLLEGEIATFFVGPSSPVAGKPLAELSFPAGAAAMLVIRGHELLAPKGRTVLEPGDHVHVFLRPGDRARVHALFGQDEDE
jgi:cell volume regulation protein A